MKKILFVVIVMTVLYTAFAHAMTQQEINQAKSLIDAKVDCIKLSDAQLEIIGEYAMEQMHPGESHEQMHAMMGLNEGSEAEGQFHLRMAKMMYCGQKDASSGDMMGTMPMMNMGGQDQQTNMGRGMMDRGYFGYLGFMNFLHVILLVGLIMLVYLWIFQVWKNIRNKGVKK